MLGKIIKDILSGRNRSLANVGLAGIDDFPETEQAERGRILCFSADSEGNALDHLLRELASPFASLASEIVHFDLNAAGWLTDLKEKLSDPIWFGMAFFGVGQEIEVVKAGRRVNLWEAHGIPFVRIYGDTPAYFPDRHMQMRRGSINLYTDKAHQSFYQRWFPAPAPSLCLFPTLLDPLPFDKVDVEAKMRGKIIFPKNGNSPGQLIDYWRSLMPAPMLTVIEAVAEESVGQAWIDREPCFDDRLIQHFGAYGIDIAADPVVLCFLVAQLDDYVRRVKSAMIAEALLDLPVIIRGRFWDHVSFQGKRATYDPDSNFARTQTLIDQAPAVVDMSPNKQHSAHDRIRRAAGRWTAFLTNKTRFLDELIPQPERFSFRFQREAIRALVEQYATNPRLAIDLGFEQAEILRKTFDERKYTDAVATAVAVSALSIRSRPPGTQNFVAFPPANYGRLGSPVSSDQ